MAKLFTSLSIKNMTLKNRIVMSPMVMNACKLEDGKVNNWHKIHYTSRAVGQVGLIVLESTAVTSQGRISSFDLGIWSDDHIKGLQELVNLIHEQDAKAAIQLAHAGRKSEINIPIIAPSAIPFDEDMQTPVEMTFGDIKEVIHAFGNAAKRAAKSGFDAIEIHAAHGYLINQFLSPLTNKRTDQYGGNQERRYHFLKEIIDEIKEYWQGPLFVRMSVNEYHSKGNHVQNSIYYAKRMKEQGVDLIDCSSGGVVRTQTPIKVYPGYQVSYAEKIKHDAGMLTGAVGLITHAVQAEEILQNDRADLIFLGRAVLRNPYWPRNAAKDLGVKIESPVSYIAGWNT